MVVVLRLSPRPQGEHLSLPGDGHGDPEKGSGGWHAGYLRSGVGREPIAQKGAEKAPFAAQDGGVRGRGGGDDEDGCRQLRSQGGG